MSTERLRAAFEGMAVGMILKGAEGETLESNPALRRMLGYGEEELRGMTRSDYTHPEDAGRDAQLYRQLLAGERDSFRMEKRYVRKDGSVMWGRLSVSRIEGAEGEPAFAVGVVEDITESREAAQEIERLNRQNRLILDSAGEGIYGLDAEGKTTFVNPAATAMTSYEPEDMIGKSQHEVVHHSRPDGTPYPREECPIYAALTDGEVHHVDDEIFWRKDGTSFPVEYTSTPILEDDEIVGAVVTFTDATERKGMEEALRRSESSLATAQRIAHLGNWDYDITEDEAQWSDEMYHIFGFAPRQFAPRYRTFLNSVHPEDRDLIRSSVRKALYEEKQGSVDYRVVRPDGDIRVVQSQYEVVREVSGRAVKLVGTVHDITERKQAEEHLRETEKRYRTLVEAVPAVTYTDRAVGSYPNIALYTSPQIEALVGYSVEEWLDPERDLWKERLHPEDRAWVLATDERSKASGEPFAEEYRLIAKDGSVVWVRDEAALTRDEAGEPLYWQGVLVDATERKKAEEALRESEEHFRALTQNSSDVVTLLGGTGTIRYQSLSIERILGYRQEEMIGDNTFEYVHPDDRERVEMAFAEGLVDSRRRPSVEYRFRHKDGSWVWLESVGTNLLDDPGVGEYVVNSRDVTERKRAEQRLAHQALHDSLLDLPNRRLFVDRLRQALRRTRRQWERKVAVLFMDLDQFKTVNDSLGHEVGDRLLVAVAERLSECLRPEDTLARFGGDEFAVLLEDVQSPEDAVRVAERILKALSEPFLLHRRELFVSVSIGVAFGGARWKRPEDLLRDADTAMYEAKSEAASGYRVFDPAMHERVLGRLELENDLRRAVEQEEFVFHYQPIFDFGSQEVWGVEALVRWDHPERGLLGPSEFVAVAEETGLIVPIGACMLGEACRQTKEWQRSHPRNPPLSVIVNLSAKQLRHPDCEETISEALVRSGLGADSLSLDVTESAFIDALEGNAQALERIQAMGVRISIDDFGMGYSSLSYLKRLPADALKIDKSFLKGFGENTEDTAIVRIVIDVAHTLGLEVVAEGVETWAQATLLAETGCDMAQGFHFAEPLPPEAVVAFLSG